MITAKFDFNLETFEASLIVRGHASFAEVGTDIVCASATILAYTIAEIVQQMEERERLEAVIMLEVGDACVSCKCKDKNTFTKILNAFDVVRTGFTLLADNYPQNVNVQA